MAGAVADAVSKLQLRRAYTPMHDETEEESAPEEGHPALSSGTKAVMWVRPSMVHFDEDLYACDCHEDFYACVTRKEVLVASLALCVQFTTFLVVMATVEGIPIPTRNWLRGLEHGLNLGWSIGFYHVFHFLAFGQLHLNGDAVPDSYLDRIWWLPASVSLLLKHRRVRAVGSALFFPAVTTWVALLPFGLSWFCIAITGVVAQFLLYSACALCRHGIYAGSERISCVAASLIVVFGFTVIGYFSSCTYLWLAKFGRVAGVILPCIFTSLETSCRALIGRILSFGIRRKRPLCKAATSWTAMLIHVCSKAFRMATSLVGTILLDSDMWFVSLVVSFVLDVCTRTLWMDWALRQLTGRQAFLPSCSTLMYMENKFYLGYERFVAPVSLMLARFLLGGSGPWYFTENFLAFVICSFLFEVAQDLTVYFINDHRWGAPMDEHARRTYASFDDEDPRKAFAFTDAGEAIPTIRLQPFPSRMLYANIASIASFFVLVTMVPFLSMPYMLGICSHYSTDQLHFLFWGDTSTCLRLRRHHNFL